MTQRCLLDGLTSGRPHWFLFGILRRSPQPNGENVEREVFVVSVPSGFQRRVDQRRGFFLSVFLVAGRRL